MSNFFGKTTKDFDAYEKVVFEILVGYNKILSITEKIKILEGNQCYKYVHYKDKWDLQVYCTIQMEQCEYSGGLVVLPYTMLGKFNKSISKMCCGIHTSLYTCVSGRKYYVGFDYGH